MTVELVHRPARTSRPLEPSGQETVAAPPTAAGQIARGLPWQALLPVAGAFGSGVMIVVFRSANRAFLLVAAVVMVVAVAGGIGVAFGQRGSAARERRAQRENYLDYLETLRSRMRTRGRDLRASALQLDPPPEALLHLARDPARLWERRSDHPDFLAVRIGLGDEVRFSLLVPPEQDPVHPYDPILHAEALSTARQCAVVRGIPIAVRLDGAGQVALIGDRTDVLAATRSLLLQLATLHAPEDLAVAAAFPESAAADWYGTDLLPHLVDTARPADPLPVRRVAASAADLGVLLGPELAERSRQAALRGRGWPGRAGVRQARMVVFVDDHGQVASHLPLPEPGVSLADLGVTVVHLLANQLQEPSDVTVRIVLDRGIATISGDGRPEVGQAVADLTSQPLFEAVARTLCGRRLSLTGPDAAESAEGPDGVDLLGIGELDRLDAQTAWRPRSPRDFLRVPIGVDDLGAPVLLDLKEAAQLGMGPHGLCVGATGSGKSELLRTLILSLTVAHPPEDLSLVLVDYKGGAAFAPFAPLPQVAGIIDNLAEDSQLTERARTSINGEVIRRQELLKAAGSSPSIGHYRQLRRTRPELPALPYLLIVIDEFGELLTADPDFVDLLLTIGRIGRSIGVHLLLSSQRIETGKLRGLETYLSYRIGLRTFSEAESSTVLDTKDAFHLPPVPGWGYLKVDTTVYRRFRSGYVSGPAPELRTAREPEPAAPTVVPLPIFHSQQVAAESPQEPPDPDPAVGRTLLAACVDRLRAADRQVPPVWLPPLPSRVPLPVQASLPRLSIPLGLLDDPAGQRQDVWSVDLARGGGHLAVIGAPQSGRSTLLRSLAVSAALTHTPRELSIYGMDLSGGGLRGITGFPHVGGVATRGQRDRLHRVLEELLGMLATREQVFAEHGIDSLAMLRAEHAAGRIPELVAPDVVLLVDGASQLRTDFESLEEPLLQLLRSGSSFGIHVVLALTRWNDLRMAHQPLVGTRLELRVNDPVDSVVDRKLAALIRPDQPGRVLTEDRRFVQVALPAERPVEPAAVAEEIRSAAAEVRARWTGPCAQPVRLLPALIRLDEVPVDAAAPTAVLGIRQDTMAAACLELDGRDQHLIALGDPGAGRTTLLTTVVRGLVDRMTPDEVVFAVMDLRGDLARAVPPPYLGAHATNSTLARGLAESVAVELHNRSVDRSAGSAARHIVVAIDDHDVIGSGDRDLLRPLLPYLPSARDLGLHLLLTRPVAGAARALYDPVLQAIRDTGGSVLLMSGDAGEGQLLPRMYAEPLPPGRGRFIRRGEPPFLIQVACG